MFLTALTVTVPMLVIYKGGDALSVCFVRCPTDSGRVLSIFLDWVHLFRIFSVSDLLKPVSAWYQNTIAILFMTEVVSRCNTDAELACSLHFAADSVRVRAQDNVCYHFALGERVRSRVEQAGHVDLSDAQAAMLVRTKVIHVFLVVFGILNAVSMAGRSLENPLVELDRSGFAKRGNENFSNFDRMLHGPGGRFQLGMFVLTMLLWLGGVLEAFGRGLGTRDVVVHVATVTGVRLASFIVMGVIVMASAV